MQRRQPAGLLLQGAPGEADRRQTLQPHSHSDMSFNGAGDGGTEGFILVFIEWPCGDVTMAVVILRHLHHCELELQQLKG